jgi:hypothetical protein
MSYDVHVHILVAHLTAAPHETDVEPVRNQHAGALATAAANNGTPRPYDGGPS